MLRISAIGTIMSIQLSPTPIHMIGSYDSLILVNALDNLRVGSPFIFPLLISLECLASMVEVPSNSYSLKPYCTSLSL